MNKKYWLAFSSIENIGSAFIYAIYSHCRFDIERAWKISDKELKTIDGIRKRSAEVFLSERSKISPDSLLDQTYNRGIGVLVYSDDDYPLLLKNIFNPPMVLFYKGDFSRCNMQKMLAVVGSRNISIGATDNLRRILSDFKNTDLTIVSGGAIGADTVAHKSAVENGISTIAVLGSGFDNIYPGQNKKLFEKIAQENGVVLTEFFHTSPPVTYHFPMRNRIVSGLCQGTLIAEASLKSGALITANLALEQGREIMCIPGAISNPNTRGIYKLIKQGAAIVTNFQDILDTMGWKIVINREAKTTEPKGLNDIEKEIYELISKDSLTIDNIFTKLTNKSVSFSDLMIILTTLEVKGIIKITEGCKYSAIV